LLRRAASTALAAGLVLLVQAPVAGAAAGNGVIAFEGVGLGPGSALWTVKPNGRDQHRLPQGPDNSTRPEYSPSGRSMAVVLGGSASGGQLTVLSAATGEVVRQVPTPAAADNPTWSRDGRQLAFEMCEVEGPNPGVPCVRYGVYRARLDGSRLKRLATGGFPSWSPDGRRIAYLAETQYRNDSDRCPALKIMSASTGRERRTVVPAQRYDRRNCVLLTAPDFAPGGERLLYRERGSPLGPVTPAVHSVGADGRGTAVVVRVREKYPRPLLGSARFSPDGRFVVYTASGRDKESGVWVVPARGGKPRRVTVALSVDVAWAPAR
jgi:Tol biopolymer transport system component